jgi:hypothetical protein
MGTNGRTGREQCGHGTGATNQRASALRTAGNEGDATGRLRLWVFFADPQVLKKRERDHSEQGVMVEAVP